MEAAEEFVEGVEDLGGELVGDFRLVLAAFLEQGFEAGGSGGAEEAVVFKEELEGSDDGASGDAGHGADGEAEGADGFAAGGVDEAELALVVE